MSVVNLAASLAAVRGWPSAPEAGGGLRLEVPAPGGRTQVVTVSVERDRNGDPAAMLRSTAADLSACRDPWSLLRANSTPAFGHVAVLGGELVVLSILSDTDASPAQVARALVDVARIADDLERQLHGASTDQR
jgi:hypothetical protein